MYTYAYVYIYIHVCKYWRMIWLNSLSLSMKWNGSHPNQSLLCLWMTLLIVFSQLSTPRRGINRSHARHDKGSDTISRILVPDVMHVFRSFGWNDATVLCTSAHKFKVWVSFEFACNPRISWEGGNFLEKVIRRRLSLHNQCKLGRIWVQSGNTGDGSERFFWTFETKGHIRRDWMSKSHKSTCGTLLFQNSTSLPQIVHSSFMLIDHDGTREREKNYSNVQLGSKLRN